MTSPWYAYPMDKPPGVYGSYPDPMGPFPKPDTNICVPSGVPITALGSGTVTSVRSGCSWCNSVTVRLDNPLNSVATHMAYNFLGGSNVQVGQHVSIGQQVGYARGGSGVCTAFALTHDDVYGTSTFSQYAGSKELDPRPILNAARAGQPLPASTGTSGDTTSLPFGLDAIIPPLKQSFTNFVEEASVFILALVVIILGVMLLAGKQISGVTKSAVEKSAGTL